MRRLGSIAAIVIALSLTGLPAAAVEVGEKAPDFELTSTQGKFKLSEFAGKKIVIVQFYVLDFTPT